MKTITNKSGRQFLGFIKMPEKEMQHYQPLAGSFAVIQCNDKYLLCFNKWRKQWELPAGSREEGETARDCAERELYEETGQKVNNLTFKGLLEIGKGNGAVQYNPVYFSTIKKLQPFIENEETTEIKLWNGQDDIGYIDEVDIKIFGFLAN